MSQIEFENDGYEYQPSEHSEQQQPTPSKPPRTTFQGFTQESLAYSASSQDTNRIAQSITSPNFNKGPHILINNEQDQSQAQKDPNYLNKLKNQYSPQLQNITPKNPPNQSQQSPVQWSLPKVVQVIKPNQQSTQKLAQSPTPTKSNENIQYGQQQVVSQTKSLSQSQQPVTIEELQQQLTQERLNSEQLRIYNHIIKMELEKKLINQGVFIINPKNRRKNENAIDLYLEIQHNRVQMQTMQNEYKQKDSIILHLENSIKQCNQINDLMKRHEQELQQQNDELSQSLEEAINKMNQANQAILTLEQEKESLLDYVDETKELLKKQEENHIIQEKKNQELVKQLQDAQNKINIFNAQSQKISQLEIDLDGKKSEIEEADKMRKKLTKAMQEKQKEVMQYQLQLTEQTNKLTEYEQANRELSRQCNESMHQVTNLRKVNDEQQSQINYLNENIEMLNLEYESNMSKTGRQINEVDKIIYEKEKLIQQQQNELETILTQNTKMQQEFSQLLQIHQQYGALQEKHMNALKSIEELKLQQEQKEQEIFQLQSQLSEKSQDFEELVDQFNDKNNRIQSLEGEIEQMNQTIVNFKEYVNKLQSERQQILEELETINNQYQIQIKEKSEEIELITSQKVDLELQINQQKEEVDELKQMLKEKQEQENQYNKLVTNRASCSDIKNSCDTFPVKQIQPYQQNTVVKRKYYL